MRTVFEDVVGPNVVGMFGTPPNTGAVVQPEAPALGLLDRHLQTLRRQIRSTGLSLTIIPPRPEGLRSYGNPRGLRQNRTVHGLTGNRFAKSPVLVPRSFCRFT